MRGKHVGHESIQGNFLWTNLVFAGLFLGVLVGGYALREPLNLDVFQNLEHQLFPCKKPLTYSLGTFDTEFGITKEQFLAATLKAEQLWEAPIDKELFQPTADDGDITINLHYDYRQETTQSLQDLNLHIENNQESYNELRVRYDVTYTDYQREKTELEAMTNEYNEHRSTYEAEVSRVNAEGGASPQEYRQLKQQERQLNAEAATVNTQVAYVNELAGTTNTLARALNDLADRLNIAADTYNTIGAELGDEFVEGTFGASAQGNEINIYQFEDAEHLVRVMAHEFGHALGMDHVEDPEAIMYRLNQGENPTLTEADISALKSVCRLD